MKKLYCFVVILFIFQLEIFSQSPIPYGDLPVIGTADVTDAEMYFGDLMDLDYQLIGSGGGDDLGEYLVTFKTGAYKPVTIIYYLNYDAPEGFVEFYSSIDDLINGQAPIKASYSMIDYKFTFENANNELVMRIVNYVGSYDVFYDMSYVVEPLLPGNTLNSVGPIQLIGMELTPNLVIRDYSKDSMGSVLSRTTNFNNALVTLQGTTYSPLLGLNGERISSTGNLSITSYSSMYFNSNGNYYFSSPNTSVPRPFTISSSGRIGIGTSYPAKTLDVWAKYSPNLRIYESTLRSSVDISIASVNSEYAPYSAGGDAIIGKSGGGSLHLNLPNLSNDGSRSISIGDNYNGKTFNVFNNGKVTIGETDPTIEAKLSVNGTIRATEIKVEANGQTADFVFGEDYNLRSLDEIETYIKANKHLPDIPSAKEMEESGVNLAEMNKLLLQKVEELTLYAIQQKKEKEELEVEVKEMKEKYKDTLEAIEERLAKFEVMKLKK